MQTSTLLGSPQLSTNYNFYLEILFLRSLRFVFFSLSDLSMKYLWFQVHSYFEGFRLCLELPHSLTLIIQNSGENMLEI